MTNDFYARLRAANLERLPQFKNKQGLPAHSQPDGSDWSLMRWCNATLGELGETANVIKKIERGDFILESDGRLELGKEIADVLTYLDITAYRFGSSPLSPNADTSFPPPPPEDSASAYFCGRCMMALSFLFINAIDPDPGFDDGTLEKALGDFTFNLGELARSNGIDIEQATVSEFNEVSNRVGSTVRM